jgi:ABC-type molybdate transport system permease subunit
VFDISPTEWTAIQLSLRVAAVATLVATPLGIAVAWLLARRDFWGKSTLDALIHLPLVLPGVLAGMVLGFAKAIGEFGATITFVSNIPGETQTISSAIYSLIQTPDGDTAALRLVVVSTVIALAALIASEWFARRALRRLHGN